MISRLYVLLAFVLAQFAFTSSSHAADMLLAHIGASGSLHDAASREFTRRVHAQLGDAVHIEVMGNSALGGDIAHLEKLKAGKLEFALVGTSMTTVDDVFAVFELPFLIRNRAHIKRVRAAIFEDTFQAAAKAKGYRLLAMWELGFRHITNTVRPINSPEDLKGIRMRVPLTPWLPKAFAAFGATIVPVKFDQVLDELKKGSIDGQETVLQLAYACRFHEAQKYLSLTSHVYTTAFLTVSEEHFSKLPKDVQDRLTQIAVEVESWSRTYGEQLDRETLVKLQEKMIVNDTDLIEFYQAAAKSVYRDFAKAIPKGGELIKRIDALANADSPGN
jgi:TRAP-type transport system periplasmic protein